MPYTFGNRRNASRSFSTPFCAHTTGVPGRADAASSRSAGAVSCVFMARTTTVPGVHSTPDASPTARPARLTRRRQCQPVAARHREVLAARDQADVVAGLVQTGTDGAADGSGPVDD